MGLDLSIREQLNEHYDEFGRRTWTVVELDNFRGCWEILEQFNLRQNIENCSTVCFQEGTFFAILDKLKEMQEQKTIMKDLSREIEQLECFIEENGLKREILPDDEDYGTDECWGRTFEVHAWW